MARVIVAVANGGLRATIAQAVRKAGHEVYATVDAEDCLARLDRKGADLLLLDPCLGRLEALHFVTELRRRGHVDRTAIVLVEGDDVPPAAWAAVARQAFHGVLAGGKAADVDAALAAALGPENARAAPGAAPPPEIEESYASRAGGAAAAGAPAAGQASGGAGARDEGKPTLLLVEDVASVRVLVGLRLESAGWTVEWTESAEGALAFLATSRCNAVLSDIDLPGMSGNDLAGVIVRRYPYVRVFLMTGMPRDAWPTPPPGVTIYPKPLRLEHLLQMLRETA